MLYRRSRSLRCLSVAGISGPAVLTIILAVPAQSQVAVTAFVDVSVIPMDRERVLKNQTVVVQGDRIVALGPASQVSVPVGGVRVDGRGKFLMPGLGDCHAHLGEITLIPGKEYTGWRQHPDVEALLFSFVANGVTTVREMHGGPPLDGQHWIPALRQRVASGDLLGPRISAAGDHDYSSPAAAAKSVVALKSAGYDFVKFANAGDGVLYDSVAAAARRVGLPVVGHALMFTQDLLARAFTDRWASVEHLFGYFPHVTGSSFLTPVFALAGKLPPRVDDAALRKVAYETKRAGVWNCPTPVINETSDGVDPFSEGVAWETDFNHRLIKALYEADAGLLLGTDAGIPEENLWLPVGGFAIHRALELLVEAGLTPYQALETGTRNIARFLHVLDSTGTVMVGKRADLVLLKANPLVDIGNTRALAGVMVGGRWISRTELEQRINTKPADSTVRTVERSIAPKWGTADVQLRLLSHMLWR